MVSETIRVRVRFSEVDPIRMVWHGNYVKYMQGKPSGGTGDSAIG